MSRFQKVLDRVLSGDADANIDFQDLVWLLERLGFELRIKGSHRILTRDDLKAHVVLQPQGAQAKAYQVRQVREVLEDLNLGGD